MSNYKIVWPEDIDLSHNLIVEKTEVKASKFFTSSILELLDKHGFEIYGDLDSYIDDTGKDVLILKIYSKERPRFRRTILVREF